MTEKQKTTIKELKDELKFLYKKYNHLKKIKKFKEPMMNLQRIPIKTEKYMVENKDYGDDAQVVEEMFGRLILCPKCIKPLTQYHKTGRRKTKRGDDKERFTCLRCGYNFTLYGIDFKMKYSKKKILKFIKLLKAGETKRNITKKLKIGHATFYRWKKKYGFMNSL